MRWLTTATVVVAATTLLVAIAAAVDMPPPCPSSISSFSRFTSVGGARARDEAVSGFRLPDSLWLRVQVVTGQERSGLTLENCTWLQETNQAPSTSSFPVWESLSSHSTALNNVVFFPLPTDHPIKGIHGCTVRRGQHMVCPSLTASGVSFAKDIHVVEIKEDPTTLGRLQVPSLNAFLQAPPDGDEGWRKEGAQPPTLNVDPSEADSAAVSALSKDNGPGTGTPAGGAAAAVSIAGGMVIKTVVTACLADVSTEDYEKMSHWVAKVASKRIAKLMNGQDFEKGTRMDSLPTPPFAKHVIDMLIPRLTDFLTDAATTSFTSLISPLLEEGIQNDIDTQVEAKTTENVNHIVSAAVYQNLAQIVPDAVDRMLPSMIVQPIVDDLQKTLTRAITHVLTPTLTYVLSQSPAEHLACSYCASYGTYCNQCSEQPDALATKIYTANYFASYYSDYYAELKW